MRNDLMWALVKHFGSQVKTAKALGVSQASVSSWCRSGGDNPRAHGMRAETALLAEKLTKKKFLAVDLCPRLKWVQ